MFTKGLGISNSSNLNPSYFWHLAFARAGKGADSRPLRAFEKFPQGPIERFPAAAKRAEGSGFPVTPSDWHGSSEDSIDGTQLSKEVGASHGLAGSQMVALNRKARLGLSLEARGGVSHRGLEAPELRDLAPVPREKPAGP